MLRRALNTIALAPGESPQWVQLLPAGTFAGRDGAGPYRLDDPQAVITATLAAASGADLPIDYDHQTLWTRENGQPAVAAGWIKAYEARPDGVWGRVEWTPAAAARLKDHEYRYLSPVFWFSPDGAVSRIECAALTNTPNLELAAVASRLPNHDGGAMDLKQFCTALAAALGLPADTPPDSLLAKAKGLVGKGKTPAAMAKRLGLAEDAAPETVEQAVTACLDAMDATAKVLGLPGRPIKPEALAAHAKELLATHGQALTTDAPDPTKYVPVEQLRAVNDRLGALETKMAGDAATKAVEAAMAAGKVVPATKEWALAYASKNLPEFEALMKVAPVIVKPGREGPAGQSPPASGELGEEDLAVCSQLGLSHDAYKKQQQQLHKEGA